MKNKVWDCFCFFNELDLLEIRFNILDEHVDFFVLGQSEQTFSGKEKPLYFNLQDERWSKWKDKIITAPIPKIENVDSFQRAGFQKDYLRRLLYPDCKPDDIIYFGDVDEIWKPQTQEGKLRQLNYCYYLNNRSSEEWYGTNMFLYKNIRNLNDIRADHSVYLDDGGWHFSNQGGADQILKKLEAYDHQEFNREGIKSTIKEKIENGEDYVGRKYDWQGKPFTFRIEEVDIPQYILDNREKWKHLLKQ